MAARPRYKSGPKKGKFMSNRAIAAKRAASKRKRTRASAKPKKRTRRKTVAKKKRRRRRRTGYVSTTEKAKVAGAGLALGWLQSKGYLAQLPGATYVGQGTKGYAALGGVSHVLAKKLKSRWLDRVAQASFVIAGYKFGEADLTMQGDHGMAGFDDAMDEEDAQVSGLL